MRNLYTAFFIVCSIVSFAQQATPWERVAPPGSTVYTDLRTALKEPEVVYRMELNAIDILKERKQLEKLNKLNNLTALRLNNQDWVEVPTPFLYLSGLVYFSAANIPLAHCKDSIALWGQLKFAEFSGTNFDTLPLSFNGWTRLLHLSVIGNKDTMHILNESGTQKELQELKLYRNHLIIGWDSVFQYPELKKLVVYKSEWKAIPQAIMQHTVMEELWLDSNSIATVPSSIWQMKSLKILSLRNNSITKVHHNICFLTQLQVLDLRGNPIDSYDVRCLQALLPQCRILH
jgi:hypothetical protein